MDNRICEKFAKCPIFQKGVLFNELTGETYKNLYCMRADKYKTCKRYLASAECACSIPETIMPNSSLSIEEIVARAKEKNAKNI
ncbi:MAG: hypothetical protein IKR94_05665 [Bacteroidales bacterium]|nr:hypothetical protein [Bacteroidales bacterium]MBR4214787.1 hypothetical protein [Bacteroidales bacterium]